MELFYYYIKLFCFLFLLLGILAMITGGSKKKATISDVGARENNDKYQKHILDIEDALKKRRELNTYCSRVVDEGNKAIVIDLTDKEVKNRYNRGKKLRRSGWAT